MSWQAGNLEGLVQTKKLRRTGFELVHVLLLLFAAKCVTGPHSHDATAVFGMVTRLVATPGDLVLDLVHFPVHPFHKGRTNPRFFPSSLLSLSRILITLLAPSFSSALLPSNPRVNTHHVRSQEDLC